MLRNELYRIIDANINRASEALRVLEDWVRLGKDNQIISEKLKKIRHEINNSFAGMHNLILSRESVHDVGRNIENNSKRNSIKDILHANCKRLEEALRVLAEYGQLLNIDTKRLEENRYEIYTIEKEVLKNEKILRLQNASLYLVTNRAGFDSDKEFLKAIEESIKGGIDIIQLREKEEKESKILELAKEIKKLTNNTHVLFIINDRVDIALAADADGVHLGQNDMPVSEARKITPEGFIIGLSTHSIEQGQNALHSGADYLGVGPVFPTPTKPDYAPTGLEYVSWASQNIKDTWFAIGGIDERNIDKVINAGAKKIAVVRAIMNASDPLKGTKQLKELLTKEKLNYEKVR
ncbi:MAG: thiamine phosphate synthase [Candidatus Melainabacteria bacterium]|nr:thiamine phosphate synthase [Candidatus Melainabacteria bacterium]